MAKRVGVVLSGCGHRDGTDVHEAVLVLVGLDRAGAEAICIGPDVPQAVAVDHRSGEVSGGGRQKRSVIVESARISPVSSLAGFDSRELDAVIFPGGAGVTLNLSTYAEKGPVCDVHPDAVRILKELLAARKPIGLIGLASILAARVLGPVAGVRLTFGSKASPAAKHAAIMGADVRHCEAGDIVVDQKSRVISSPGAMIAEAPLRDLAAGVDKLVRAVLSQARDRHPAPPVAP